MSEQNNGDNNEREEAKQRASMYVQGMYAGGPGGPDNLETLHGSIMSKIKGRAFEERNFEGKDYKQGQGIKYKYEEDD